MSAWGRAFYAAPSCIPSSWVCHRRGFEEKTNRSAITLLQRARVPAVPVPAARPGRFPKATHAVLHIHAFAPSVAPYAPSERSRVTAQSCRCRQPSLQPSPARSGHQCRSQISQLVWGGGKRHWPYSGAPRRRGRNEQGLLRARCRLPQLSAVMAGLVPAIHVLMRCNSARRGWPA
jgi:hypothetical protein